MPTPTSSGLSTAFASFLAVVFGASFPTIDAGLFIASFAGSTVFITQSKDMPQTHRALSFLVSWIMGYMVAPSLVEYSGINSPELFAFCLSATLVFAVIFLIGLIKSGRILDFINRRG